MHTFESSEWMKIDFFFIHCHLIGIDLIKVNSEHTRLKYAKSKF